MSGDRTRRRLDDAARAAWLYYVAARTQDEIAAELGVSRQSAQRLVAQAMTAGLVKVRIDHPISECLELGREMCTSFGLTMCEVAPDMPDNAARTRATAQIAGDVLEGWLGRDAPQVIGLGTGRTLRAAVEHLPHVTCDAHRIVSLTGNIAPDGSTAYYNVLFTVTDKVTATTYPLPMPVIAATPQEREMLIGQKTIAATRGLALGADVFFVGIGTTDDAAPLLLDGFIDRGELARLRDAGAAGEILGWVYDDEGRLLEGHSNDRVCSVPLSGPPVIAVACGAQKVRAIRGAIRGGLITSLITDAGTARDLLSR
jgi:YD repeat-containing protein